LDVQQYPFQGIYSTANSPDWAMKARLTGRAAPASPPWPVQRHGTNRRSAIQINPTQILFSDS
jgi:hypothetical protein